MMTYRNGPKRLVDLLIAVPLAIFSLPVIAALATAVRLGMGSPVLFCQQRAGKGGRPFTILKYRTMSDLRDSHGELLPDEERLTPLGRLMRRLSLDELPQLWNVLRGDMSLVGPRPLLVSYLPRYSRQQARRHPLFCSIINTDE